MKQISRTYAVACLFFSAAALASAGDKQPAAAQAPDESAVLKACGPRSAEVRYSADTDKSQHPVPSAPADEALVFVVRPTMMGNKVQTKLAADGEWKGVNRGNNYFFFTLPPGDHYFCSAAENLSIQSARLEGGKTYFLQQHVKMGLMKAGNRLELLSEEEGRKALAKCHLSTWTTK